MCYELWRMEKVAHQTGQNRGRTTLVVRDYLPPLKIHHYPDIERKLRDTSRDHDRYTYGSDASPPSALTYDRSAPSWLCSGFSCSSTCSDWAVGVNARAYSLAPIFVFLMPEYGWFAIHHVGRCTSERHIHSYFDGAVVSSSRIGSSLPRRTQLNTQR